MDACKQLVAEKAWCIDVYVKFSEKDNTYCAHVMVYYIHDCCRYSCYCCGTSCSSSSSSYGSSCSSSSSSDQRQQQSQQQLQHQHVVHVNMLKC